jgi:hypothetical protein
MVVSGWDPRPWREKRASFAFPTDAEWEADLRLVQTQLGAVDSNLGFPLSSGSVQPAFNIYAWNGALRSAQHQLLMNLRPEAIASAHLVCGMFADGGTVLAIEFGEGGMMAPTHGWQYQRLEAITRVFGKIEGAE